MNLSSLFRYDVDQSIIGAGGCGELRPARDRLLDRPVAIKTIRDELAGDRRAVRSFEQEAVASARLARGNKHIVDVTDLGRVDDYYYLVMEWIPPGETGRPDVSALTGACSVMRARQILLHACDATSYAHRRGIVHSDIAPWNILYRASTDSYLLADFGLAKVVQRDLLSVPSRTLLSGGRSAFVPAYVRNDFNLVSRATDTFALAVTFWQLLSGDSVLRHSDSIPPVVTVALEQRDAPPQVRQLLTRFIEGHTRTDSVAELVEMLDRVPAR